VLGGDGSGGGMRGRCRPWRLYALMGVSDAQCPIRGGEGVGGIYSVKPCGEFHFARSAESLEATLGRPRSGIYAQRAGVDELNERRRGCTVPTTCLSACSLSSAMGKSPENCVELC
jgi:hypothetical protein